MPHAIPEPYVWDESFKVFYDQLDTEHKGLFDGVFKCAGARSDDAALKSLAKLVKDHFHYEEGEMQSHKYADYPAHKKIHEDFLKELGKLKCPLGDDAIHFAKDWLVQHIKNVDFNYKGKLA